MIERFKTFFKSLSQTKLVFIILGIGSTIWFLIRVIPKPSRAGYPCMRAAAPIMSGFVIYLLALGGSTLLFRRAISKLKQARYMGALLAIHQIRLDYLHQGRWIGLRFCLCHSQRPYRKHVVWHSQGCQ